MASNYPSSLDALANPSSGSTMLSPSHSTQHTNANDAIEAIQATLGRKRRPHLDHRSNSGQDWCGSS